MIQMILDNGVIVNQVSSQIGGAFHILTEFDGAHEQAKKFAELLMTNGADVNAVDLDGNAPLHSMVDVHNVDVFKLLVE